MHFSSTLVGRTYRRVLLVPLLRYYLRHRAAMGHSALTVLKGFASRQGFFEVRPASPRNLARALARALALAVTAPPPQRDRTPALARWLTRWPSS